VPTALPDPPGPIAMPVAGGPLVPLDRREFSFLVGGHMYGDPGRVTSMPSPTFVAAADRLAGEGDAFLVSCGDLFRAMMDLSVEPTLHMLGHLRMPVFNAPGNHDWIAAEYTRRFGPGYGAFRYGDALFILLNTEIEPWHISGEQLVFLQRTIDFARSDPAVFRVFCFAHKLVFAVDAPRYEVLFEHANARDGFEGRSNFVSDVAPLLAPVARSKEVVWFGGDVGVSWSLSLFVDTDPDTGITYVGTGMGDTRRDCLVRVRVRAGARSRLEPVPLPEGATLDVGEPVRAPIEAYGIDHWRQAFAPK
jgi:hypothetical protein